MSGGQVQGHTGVEDLGRELGRGHGMHVGIGVYGAPLQSGQP